jgi:hypothetical protein
MFAFSGLFFPNNGKPFVLFPLVGKLSPFLGLILKVLVA